MSIASKIMGGGFSAGQARAICGGVAQSVSAAGTTQGTATALTAGVNYVTTAAASSGVIVPNMEIGDAIEIYNGGANTLTVYPFTGGKINGVATNGGVSLATNTMIRLRKMTATQIGGILSA
jgi:hypothetical protein